MDRRTARILTFYLILALAMPTAGALAADIPWQSERYTLTVDQAPIPQVLKNFAADQGVSIEIAEDVSGDVSGRFEAPPQQFLETFTQTNGLAWYYDRTKLFITTSAAVTTNIYQMQNAQVEALIRALKQVGIYSERYPIQVVEDLGLIYVPGPPRYQELVNLTLQTLEAANAPNSRANLTTRVYRLRYAWADDQVVLFRNSEVILPGVATTLRNLVNGQGAQSIFVPGGNTIRNQRAYGGLNGLGLARFGGQPVNYGSPVFGQYPGAVTPGVAGPPSQIGAVAAAAQQPPEESDAIGPPSIQADPRINAVIVQDVASRLPAYDRLIAELDVPGGLVEIEATIVDINADSGFEFGPPLGTAWQRGGETKSFAFSLDPTDVATTSFTLLSDEVTELALTLQALRNRGQAEIVSSPSVLTINNVEAQLDSTTTFFVRVAGQLQVDLFDVVVGTSLRVTPHIVEEEGGGRRIKLLIQVEDGAQQQDQAVDGVPLVQRSTINTQAVLNENESLLLGGLVRHEQRSRKRGIPGLMNIPKLGVLFTNTETSTVKTQRYILLKPRIVELPQSNCASCMGGFIPLDAGGGYPVVPPAEPGLWPAIPPDAPVSPAQAPREDQVPVVPNSFPLPTDLPVPSAPAQTSEQVPARPTDSSGLIESAEAYQLSRRANQPVGLFGAIDLPMVTPPGGLAPSQTLPPAVPLSNSVPVTPVSAKR